MSPAPRPSPVPGLAAACAGVLALAAASAVAGCLGRGFHLSGGITAPPHIQKRTEQNNTVLFVVAVNAGGVPVAVRRYINPKLPLLYQLREEDLVLPGPAWKGPLNVTVHVNTHGSVGDVRPGDLTGTHHGPVHSGERHADIVIDRQA